VVAAVVSANVVAGLRTRSVGPADAIQGFRHTEGSAFDVFAEVDLHPARGLRESIACRRNL
ncbi:MAG: hypothetical protein KJ614_12690, partial [Gammaproteobacteria bacterium]|nr:hypothetical protein [Gammaproteobacteria bacterium]